MSTISANTAAMAMPVAHVANEVLLTAKEVAAQFHVSIGWVCDHASGRRRPVLPSVKLGKAVRFRPSDIRQFIEDCTRNAL